MPILGAVLTLTSDPTARAETLHWLHGLPGVDVGEPQLLGVPVAVESSSRQEEKAFWERLEAHPGVLFAAVVFHDFSDLPEWGSGRSVEQREETSV